MKRIDNIVTDIERKDKINRALFIAFVLLIAGFIAFALWSEKRNQAKDRTITVLEIKNSDTYKELEETYVELEETYVKLGETNVKLGETNVKLEEEKKKTQEQYDELLISLSPEEYWKSVEQENSVEGYIYYITNSLKIGKEFIPNAIEKLKSPDVGIEDFHGWIHAGLKDNEGNFTLHKDIVEIIYRKDDKNVIPNSEIKVGDIIKLKTRRNRVTYRNNNTRKLKGPNKQGWRNKTKAFVTEVWENQKKNNATFRIKVKYY